MIPLSPTRGSDSIVPPMTVDAYWLTPYGIPGSSDTTYIVGHSWDGRDTAFNHLSTQAKAGDQVSVTTASGPFSYTVQTVTTENKNTLKSSAIWDKVPNTLVLISCYTADLWGKNIIVTATLAGDPLAKG
ncbi:class F sortase [Pseudarthrobacter sp. Fe7]|nr:class F sortase [Pseudarthrobacter sp. Fe7]